MRKNKKTWDELSEQERKETYIFIWGLIIGFGSAGGIVLIIQLFNYLVN